MSRLDNRERRLTRVPLASLLNVRWLIQVEVPDVGEVPSWQKCGPQSFITPERSSASVCPICSLSTSSNFRASCLGRSSCSAFTMSADLIQPTPKATPSDALQLSMLAPRILKQSSTFQSLPYPLSLLWSTETQETWITTENLLISCLRTGDDKAARQCLDRLEQRFGEENERVMALRGMYEEAIAGDDKALEKVFKEYDTYLKEHDPTNIAVRKRKATLLRGMGRTEDAAKVLIELLDISPTDAEAWSELADIYFLQGAYQQAIFSLEEVILCIPNAWNMHARLGEVLYISATTSAAADHNATSRGLSEALRRFCRSVELCDNYLRGYYGLKITATKLQEVLSSNPPGTVAVADDLPLPELDTVQKLNELATSKLAEIVRKGNAKQNGWEGYDKAELIAARALLDKGGSKIER